jgi:hypothetical protein
MCSYNGDVYIRTLVLLALSSQKKNSQLLVRDTIMTTSTIVAESSSKVPDAAPAPADG